MIEGKSKDEIEEEEQLQLALAISQSEAEAKEQEKKKRQSFMSLDAAPPTTAPPPVSNICLLSTSVTIILGISAISISISSCCRLVSCCWV